MDDSGGMRGSESPSAICAARSITSFAEAFGGQGAQRFAVDQLRDEVIFAHVEDGHDVGMIESGDGPSLRARNGRDWRGRAGV